VRFQVLVYTLSSVRTLALAHPFILPLTIALNKLSLVRAQLFTEKQLRFSETHLLGITLFYHLIQRKQLQMIVLSYT
jgi:hypothetical protein